jgi:hypothetical protein
MSKQVYTINDSFYVKIGEGVEQLRLLDVPERVTLLMFSEARRFQRCDGCNYKSGEFSEVFTCLYAPLPNKAVVRTTILTSHHSAGAACSTHAIQRLVDSILQKLEDS